MAKEKVVTPENPLKRIVDEFPKGLSINPECSRCGLCQTSTGFSSESGERKLYKAICIEGSGASPTDIMFVGEAPGNYEVVRGKPFVGDAGTVFNDCLKEAGLNRAEIYTTNVVKCRPAHDPIQKAPKQKEIEACLPYLIAEIQKVKPKVIVAVGGVALKALLPTVKETITRVHGKIYTSEEFGCKVIPIYHPSYVMRKADDPSVRQRFIFDLSQIKKYLTEGAMGVKKSLTKYTLVSTLEQFQEVIEILLKAEVIDFDLETTSKSPTNGKIICISISINPNKAVVIPIWVRWEGEQKLSDDVPYWKENHDFVMTELRKVFASDIPKSLQAGALIDIPFMKAANLPVRNWKYDAILMHHLNDENAKGRSLKDMAWELTDMGGYDSELAEWKDRLLGNRKKVYLQALKAWRADGGSEDDKPERPDISFAEIPFSVLWPYAAADADVLGRVRRIMYEKLRTQDLLWLFDNIVMPLQNVLCVVEENGIKIDKSQLHSIREEYAARAAEVTRQLSDHSATEEARKILELEEVNYGSSKQLQTILFNILKLPVVKKTKGGAASTDEEVLLELSNTHEIPRWVLQLRAYQYAERYYGDKFYSAIWFDGRIHTNYLIYGTRTGRLSSRNPNLQNIPRAVDAEEDAIAAKIRNIFVVDSDELLVEVDYSQMEFRLLAQYTNDRQMIYDVVHEVDIHVKNASLIYDKPESEITKDERQNAKPLTYALIYGASAYRLCQLYGMTEDRAQWVIDSLFRRYPGAKAYHNSMILNARTRGYVKTLYGRRRRLPGIVSPDKKMRSHAEREAINAPIQGLASDILYIAMIRLQNIWKKHTAVKMCMTTHDSLTHRFPASMKDFVISTIYQEMTRQMPKITVPLAVDVKVGASLGSLKKLSSEQVKDIINRPVEIPNI